MEMIILLSGPDFYNTNNMIANAFIELNCKVKISKWPDFDSAIADKLKLFTYEKMKMFKKIELKDGLFKEKIIEYNKKLLQEITIIQPDVLIVLKGEILLPETLKKIRTISDAILVVWCYDSALRFRNVLDCGKYYHLFYTYEPSDIQELGKHNIQAKFLPMAYDPNTYFKLENETVNRDICFIGSLYGYPERTKLLTKIISQNPALKLQVWGKTWNWYNPYFQYEYRIKKRALNKNIHNNNISPDEVNTIYNSSKICLNIHHPQSKMGLNPRTFEILGAGGFQLVDYKKKIEEFFTLGQDIVCYKNENDLLNKIDYYLENESERNKIAQRGHDLVKKKHTYKHRAETILTDIEKIRGEI